MYNEAGIDIYAFRPRVFEKENTDDDIRYGMRAAKALGASHVTLEHPSDDKHTFRLSKIAEEEDVLIGYHGHEQQTPTFWDTAITQSKYNKINLDFGLPSSSFTVCSFWYINSLYKIGEKEKSKKYFEKILKYSNHLGLYSEDLDFKSKRLLGNFPQAYSHLALIDCALNFNLE